MNKINLKKAFKISGIILISLFLIFDAWIRGTEYLNTWKQSLRQEGYTFALTTIAEFIDKEKRVEIAVPNKDGKIKKLNLVLENKK